MTPETNSCHKMKTYIALYRAIASGNIETDCQMKIKAPSENQARSEFAHLTDVRHPGCRISVQAIAEVSD